MNPQVKEKWIEALRSGEYKQTTRYLRTKDGYCCLGVLMDLYLKETGKEWVPTHDKYVYLTSNMNCSPISDWADVEEFAEDVLIHMNDTEGRSFNEIADYIQDML
jgi:hypothetical protein